MEEPLKEKLKAEISDDCFSKENVPALKEAVKKLEDDYKKNMAFLTSFPGVLLLGDWEGIEINLVFFQEVAGELRQKHHCNAYTLADVSEELEKRGIVATHKQIRKRGIDAAEIVLWVEGDGKGTISESAVICEKPNWNRKCFPFVRGISEEQEKLFEKKNFLADFNNEIKYYFSVEELKAKMISQSKRASKEWIERNLDINGE